MACHPSGFGRREKGMDRTLTVNKKLRFKISAVDLRQMLTTDLHMTDPEDLTHMELTTIEDHPETDKCFWVFFEKIEVNPSG